MTNILIHITMLLVLSFAEGFRLTEFFTMQTGNHGAGVASAVVSVIVVLYLALFDMRKASIFATIVCIFLSLASFLKPYENLQVNNVKQAQASVEKPLPIPQWENRKFWGSGREDYRKSFNAEVERVKKYNERLDKLVAVSEQESLRVSEIVVFVLGALVLGFCVPVLTFTVSHKLADDLRSYKEGKPITLKGDTPLFDTGSLLKSLEESGSFPGLPIGKVPNDILEYGKPDKIPQRPALSLIDRAKELVKKKLIEDRYTTVDGMGHYQNLKTVFDPKETKNDDAADSLASALEHNKKDGKPFEPRRWPPRAPYVK